MTYKEAQQMSLNVRWKVNVCSQGEACWCRTIIPEKPIVYEDGDGHDELYIIDVGAVHKELAEHIVGIHNEYIQNKKQEYN